MRYRLHRKEGSPESLRVEYYDGMIRVASEWVCLSHEGYARKKAESWWNSRSKINAIPTNTDEAIEWLDYDDKILRRPSAVVINRQGKYPSIIGYQWDKEATT